MDTFVGHTVERFFLYSSSFFFFFFSVAEEFLHLRQWSAPRFGSFNTFRGGLLLRPDVRTFLFAYTVAFDC